MNNTSLYKIVGFSVVGIFAIWLLVGCISFSNSEIDLQSRFTQKMSERTAFYDKLWKILSQKSQIALKNDSSFQRNIAVIMDGRKDAPQVFMKWVQETNPNANYSEVSKLYADLSRTVESERDGFFMEEKMIQGVVMEHNNLVRKFPGSFYNLVFGRNSLIYKPITSDKTDRVIESGKDNDVKVF